MCGICGFWSVSSNSYLINNNVNLMTNSLRHRGPDNNNVINLDNNRLSFGHTRLSIFDLSSGGTQPMNYLKRLPPFLIMVKFLILLNCAKNL